MNIYYYIIKKEINRILRIYTQSIFPSILITILYYITIGKLIGHKIIYISGYSYCQYIIPGLILINIISNSYLNSIFALFLTKFHKNIEELIISNNDNSIIISMIISTFFRCNIIIIIILILINTITYNEYIYDIFLFYTSYITYSLIFSLLGLMNSFYITKIEKINFFYMILITPLIYLGCIFFPIEFINLHWIIYIYINPIFYIINIFKYSIIGILDINIQIIIIILTLFFIFIFYTLNLILLNKKNIK